MQHYIQETFGANTKRCRKVLKERETRMYKAKAIKAVSYKKKEKTVNREVMVTKEKKKYGK